MNDVSSAFYILTGFLLRIGIPVGLTGLLVVGLRWLDEHWAAESEASPDTSVPLVRNYGCWVKNECKPEARRNCLAYSHPEMPCWQVFRQNSGTLQPQCTKCKVFREAPVPA